MPSPYATLILDWYAASARDLPWRRPGTSPWAVLVSEIMLQQTPVARVLPALRGLAGPVADARGAGRAPPPPTRCGSGTGWATRAGRCPAARHRPGPGEPARRRGAGLAEVLVTLPGIGPYTAAAVASFAFGQRHAVLDINVRRVLARLVAGAAQPPAAPSAAERRAGPVAAAGRSAPPPPAGRWRSWNWGRWSARHRGRPARPARSSASCAWRAGRRSRRAAARKAQPGLRGHRPAVPGTAAGRAARGGRPGAGSRAGRRLA